MAAVDIWTAEAQWTAVYGCLPAGQQSASEVLQVLGLDSQDLKPGFAKAIPLAAYLQQTQGRGADTVIPVITRCLQSFAVGKGVFSQTKNIDKRQKIIHRLLTECSGVLQLADLSTVHKQQLSVAAKHMLQEVLQYSVMSSDGHKLDPDDVEAFHSLAVTELNADTPVRMPLLPEDASSLVQWWMQTCMTVPGMTARVMAAQAALITLVALSMRHHEPKDRQRGAVVQELMKHMRSELLPLTSLARALREGPLTQTPAMDPGKVPPRDVVAARLALLTVLTDQATSSGSKTVSHTTTGTTRAAANGTHSGTDGVFTGHMANGTLPTTSPAAALEDAVELMVQCTEAYVAAAVNGRVADLPSAVALSQSLVVLTQLASLLNDALSQNVLAQVPGRIRALITVAAPYVGAALAASSSTHAEKIAAWKWDVSQSLLSPSDKTNGWMALCKGLSEVLCRALAALGAQTEGSDGALRAATNLMLDVVDTVKLATTDQDELHIMLLTVGRVAAVSEGDDRLLHVVVELLLEGQSNPALVFPPLTYGVAVHALSCIAVASNSNASGQLSKKIMLSFLRLYKNPDGAVSKVLLSGGECEGVLTDGIWSVAASVPPTQSERRNRLRTACIQAFCDSALALPAAPSSAMLHNLGAMLPAIAAASISTSGGQASLVRHVEEAGGGNVDVVQELIAKEAAAIRLYRLLWLVVAIHDFDCLNSGPNGSAARWPVAWREALGIISTHSPPLIMSTRIVSAAQVDERLEYDLHEPLQRLASHSSATVLSSSLQALLGGQRGQTNGLGGAFQVPQGLSPARLAYLLGIAHLHLCRALHAPQPDHGDLMPLATVMAQLQVMPQKAIDYPVLEAITVATFQAHVHRWRQQPVGLDGSAVLASQVSVAKTLISNLSCRTGNQQVPRLAAKLLQQHVQEVKALLQSEAVWDALTHAAGQESRQAKYYPTMVVDGSLPAYQALQRFLETAHEHAPGMSSLMLQQRVVAATSTLSQHSSNSGVQDSEGLLQLFKAGRSMAAARDMEGMDSVVAKTYHMGRVNGLADEAVSQGRQRDFVLQDCVASLARALDARQDEHMVKTRFMELSAAIILLPSPSALGEAVHLLAWVPGMLLEPHMMRHAVSAWTWVMASATSTVKMELLAEMGNAWVMTVNQQQGLFDRSFDPIQYEQSTGGNPDMLAPSPDALGRRHTIVQQVEAHHTWLRWLTEVFQAYRGGKDTDAITSSRVFSHILKESLREPDWLCYHPAAAGCRFRLLTLALQYSQYCIQLFTMDIRTGGAEDVSGGVLGTNRRTDPYSLLCERVLRAAIMWGSAPVTWYGRWTQARASAEAEAVQAFCKVLSSVRRWPSCQRSPAPGTGHPIWGASQFDNQARKELASLLLTMEADRLMVWANPKQLPAQLEHYLSPSAWAIHVSTAWDVHPRVALNLGTRLPEEAAIQQQLQQLVIDNAHKPELHSIPEAAVYLAHGCWKDEGAPALAHLSLWAPLPLLVALSLISDKPGGNKAVRQYALRSMRSVPPEQVAFFLPQLVQLLRRDKEGLIADFLVDRAQISEVFASNVIAMLTSEGRPPEDAFNPVVKRSGWEPPTDTGLWDVADGVRTRVWREMPPEIMAYLKAQTHFFDEVTSISGALYPVPKDERKAKAMELAARIELPRDDLFIPTNPRCKVKALLAKSATPMRSAAKVPILVAFQVTEDGGVADDGTVLPPVDKVQACIFKVGDDIRQDVLALQVIGLLKDAFVKAGLDLVVFPYGTIPTGYEQGIIEVVPNAHSRAEYGEIADGGLYEIFQREFGAPGTDSFERARLNFLRSEAGYAIASYILQAKDRHGGNLMFNNEGYLIHIDFGFIFGISPGGNLGFENAAFKLNHEMLQLIDPSLDRQSAFYREFVDMCVRGFLAARSISSGLMATVTMMSDSGLPCFGYKEPLKTLKQRFHMELSDAEAAKFMQDTIHDAYDKWTTGFYDLIQYWQQGIPK